ncbi:MAG: electron transport complex subunit RsxC [bacterium]
MVLEAGKGTSIEDRGSRLDTRGSFVAAGGRAMITTFKKGGIHPPKGKNLTRDKAVRTLPPPPQVVLPLSQHLGVPCESKVAKGDVVKVGQVIGESPAFVSASIHASIAGKVTNVGPMPNPVLGQAPAVTIESDETDTWVELGPERDWKKLSSEEILGSIRSSGLVGLGGAAFPTHVKLSPPKDKPIKVCILNGAECEPYLTADYRLMVEETDKIITGLAIMMKVLGAEEGYIGVEDDKPEAITLLKKAVAKMNIEVVTLEAKYPQGAEKQLIAAIVGREVPSGGLPMDVGCVVQNVGTAAAITQAVTTRRPLIDRIVTVTGPGIASPQNIRVRSGSSFSFVIDQCGGLKGEPGKVIMGGPMMGIAQASLDVPVIKGTSGILVFPRAEIPPDQPGPCISCGRCLRACPMSLMPSIIGILAENERFEEAKRYNLLDCVECGCCAYVCPARRPMVHLFKYAKAALRK